MTLKLSAAEHHTISACYRVIIIIIQHNHKSVRAHADAHRSSSVSFSLLPRELMVRAEQDETGFQWLVGYCPLSESE